MGETAAHGEHASEVYLCVQHEAEKPKDLEEVSEAKEEPSDLTPNAFDLDFSLDETHKGAVDVGRLQEVSTALEYCHGLCSFCWFACNHGPLCPLGTHIR
jgi:hypothetical protein